MRKEAVIVSVTRTARITAPKEARKELQITDVDSLKGELVAEHGKKTGSVLTRI